MLSIFYYLWIYIFIYLILFLLPYSENVTSYIIEFFTGIKNKNVIFDKEANLEISSSQISNLYDFLTCLILFLITIPISIIFNRFIYLTDDHYNYTKSYNIFNRYKLHVFLITILPFTVYFFIPEFFPEYESFALSFINQVSLFSLEAISFLGFICSLLAIYYVLIQIQESKTIITSFDSFAKKLMELIDETEGDIDTNNYLRIMANTPIPGSLALSDEVYFLLQEKMKKSEARIQMMCLDQQSLNDWLSLFKGKKYGGSGRITDKLIKKAVADIDVIKNNLCHSEGKRKFLKDKPSKEHSKKSDTLNDFYLFFTNDRAIVAVPLFFPVQQISNEDDPFKDQKVEIIGFETSDAKTISNIKNFYEKKLELEVGGIKELDYCISNHGGSSKYRLQRREIKNSNQLSLF